MGANAWAARPDMQSWYATLAARAALWRPHTGLIVRRDSVIAEVVRAARSGARWLVHPCLNTLTRDAPENRYERDVLFVAWVSAHATDPLGTMTLNRLSWGWSPDGEAVSLPAGCHDLAGLLERDRPPSSDYAPPHAAFAIAIDIHCRSTGFLLPRAWPEPVACDALPSLAITASREIAHALDVLTLRLPACTNWVSAVTSVIVPLQHHGVERSSGSLPDIPGMIHLAGLHGPVSALEAVIHESAHHHFTMTEAAGALVDPTHQTLYPSPLRNEARPLARVLLAVHALWHMVRFYDDAIASGLLSPEWSDRRSRLQRQLVTGLGTLTQATPHFTTGGRALLTSLRNGAPNDAALP